MNVNTNLRQELANALKYKFKENKFIFWCFGVYFALTNDHQSSLLHLSNYYLVQCLFKAVSLVVTNLCSFL